MKAVCWYGKQDVRVENVPDPEILNPRDIIIKVTRTAICGSDLHLYNGFIPTMKKGDILGHEFMGEVVEVGMENGLKVGDRVVVPFAIACGNCFFCSRGITSACDNSNPSPRLLELKDGFASSALFGYSHMYGGYAGGQAEYVRVPYGDVGPIKVPTELDDEQVLFLSDIFPTGYQAAEACNIQEGDTIAVWGCGPVGQFTIQSAFLLGASRVIAIDRFSERLSMAEEVGAETVNYTEVDSVVDTLREMTFGMGPDACIDAVGLEAHGTGLYAKYERGKQMTMLQLDRPTVLRQVILACRKGGVVSLPGVYGGFIDKMPMGSAFGKGLTFKMGQTNVHKYLQPLLEFVKEKKIDLSRVITHRVSLQDAPDAYETFVHKEDNCIKVVMTP
jgi:threonine dehydrogenase-like Zn-dependent dehydrogenase